MDLTAKKKLPLFANVTSLIIFNKNDRNFISAKILFLAAKLIKCILF